MNKRFLLLSLILLPTTLLLSGCGDVQQTTTPEAQAEKTSNDDHHQGETDITPHDHDDSELSGADDHHAGDDDIEPHGHDGEISDDHHEGEEDVTPHQHEADHDDTGQPPHRH